MRMKRSTLIILMSLLALISFAGPAWYVSRAEPESVKEENSSAASEPSTSPFSSSQRNINTVAGSWSGAVQIAHESPVVFSFTLREADGKLTGSARFPIGEGQLENGEVSGNRFSFSTRHTLPASSQTLMTRFTGEVVDGVMSLQMRSEDSESALTLNRMSY